MTDDCINSSLLIISFVGNVGLSFKVIRLYTNWRQKCVNTSASTRAFVCQYNRLVSRFSRSVMSPAATNFEPALLALGMIFYAP